MRTLVPLIFLSAGCSSDNDAADTDPLACIPPSEGAWTMSGSCFGMAMGGTLTLNADDCAFTFADWDMAMSMPSGGTVSGDTVNFTGAGWDDCSGTTDGTSMTGACGDGCTYDGSFDG